MKVERSAKAANGGAEIRKKPKPVMAALNHFNQVGALFNISTLEVLLNISIRQTTNTSHTMLETSVIREDI